METLLPPRPSRTVRPWPYRPRPLPDELLTSYTVRLALGLDLKPITFLNTVWGSARNLLAQDLDNFVPERVATRIAQGACIDVEAVGGMALSGYVGTLLATHNPRGRNPWLLPTTIDNNRRRRHGLQFCPTCLAADPAPYFRRRWRLAFVTSCTEHGVLLRDRCATCGEPVHQHGAASPRHCSACGAGLCVPTKALALHEHLGWQARLEAGLDQGWIMLGSEPTRAHVVFSIVRQIAALLVNGARADRLRVQAARAWGGDPTPYAKPTSRQPIEYLDVAERHRLFDMVARLMQGWPHRFVHACHEADFHRSHAIRDMTDPPFAYEDVLRSYMDRTAYRSTEPEVAAAAAWLRRTKGRATYPDLKAICGESRAFIYRHMDYARRPATPSRWRVEAMSASPDGDGRIGDAAS